MKQTKILPYTILFIGISSILQWCTLPIGNTVIWWLIQSFIIYLFLKTKSKEIKIKSIQYFLGYLIFSAIYGAIFMAENYWDWKLLFANLLSISLIISVYSFMHPQVISSTLKIWYKYSWIILIFIFPFLKSDAYGRFLVPYAFLSIFISVINKKYWIIIFIAFIITYYFGYEDRSSTIKFIIYSLMGVSLAFWNQWKKISNSIFRLLHVLLLAIPFILLYLGLSQTFNIFNIKEELKIENKTDKQEEQLADTRTFLYVEEIQSAFKYNYVILGRSIARGYESEWFGEWADRTMGIKRGERQSCEVCVLNIFNYMGIIGVFLYFFIFLKASTLAIYKSNNKYVKMIGIYVAFRWMYAFIHDGIEFNLNFLFVIIGWAICFSPFFRKMNDSEFSNFIKSIIK